MENSNRMNYWNIADSATSDNRLRPRTVLNKTSSFNAFEVLFFTQSTLQFSKFATNFCPSAPKFTIIPVNYCQNFPLFARIFHNFFFQDVLSSSIEISFLVTLVLAMFVKPPYILCVWFIKDLWNERASRKYPKLWWIKKEKRGQRNTKAQLGRDCTQTQYVLISTRTCMNHGTNNHYKALSKLCL